MTNSKTKKPADKKPTRKLTTKTSRRRLGADTARLFHFLMDCLHNVIAHEAGHAIVHLAQGHRVASVEARFNPDDDGRLIAGLCRLKGLPANLWRSRPALKRMLRGLVAGHVAQEGLRSNFPVVLLSEAIRAGAPLAPEANDHWDDHRQALLFAYGILRNERASNDELADLIADAEDDARAILVNNEVAWRRLVDVLNKQNGLGRQLEEQQIEAIVGPLLVEGKRRRLPFERLRAKAERQKRKAPAA